MLRTKGRFVVSHIQYLRHNSPIYGIGGLRCYAQNSTQEAITKAVIKVCDDNFLKQTLLKI